MTSLRNLSTKTAGRSEDQEGAKRIVLAAILLLYSMALAFIFTRQRIVLVRSDHHSRWYATTKLFFEGRSLYDPQNGQEVVALSPIPVDPIEGSFFYPAHLMLLTAPLAFFPYPVAHFIWLVSIQLFLILGTWLVSDHVGWPHSTTQLTILLLLAVFSIPNTQNTIWGQFNTVGVISLALVFLALRKGQYGLAGVWAIGLTLKPQTMLLTLVFLLLWALFERKRWRFILGFGMSAFACWAVAEWLEPNWVISFLEGVRAYSAFHTPISVIAQGVQSGGILEGLVILASVAFFIYHRHSSPDDLTFAGCIALSLAAWWLVMPVLGMMYLVALPLALVLLLSALERTSKTLYRTGVVGTVLLYILGFIGFLYGLSSPQLYGVHIQLAELAYKISMPILVVILTIPLLLGTQE